MVEQETCSWKPTMHTLVIWQKVVVEYVLQTVTTPCSIWFSCRRGVDPDETAVTAIVDNKCKYNATVGKVFTDLKRRDINLEYPMQVTHTQKL